MTTLKMFSYERSIIRLKVNAEGEGFRLSICVREPGATGDLTNHSVERVFNSQEAALESGEQTARELVDGFKLTRSFPGISPG